MRGLPYPGYSWSFTQHAIGIEVKTLYGFLGCAALYEGEEDEIGSKITASMIASGLLTANVRDGVNDAWRDYQQILAELGLIYSTKISRKLRLTDAGHMYLAGEIGYSDLMGIQALRYQYPNGQKSTIQSRLAQELAANGIRRPATLLELQADHGILIKPGTLLLRLLIQLYETSGSLSISVEECLAFAMPCRKNADWPLAFSEIEAHRHRTSNIGSVNSHGRRNMQDWFSFLSKSDLFLRKGSSLFLSQQALGSIDKIKGALSAEEAVESFWVPMGYENLDKLNWFDWFGHIGYSVQQIATHPMDDEFIAKNFVGGVDDDDASSISAPTASLSMSLGNLDISTLLRNREFSPVTNVDQDMLDRINLGAFRRHSKTLLHDRIIASLAKKLGPTGASLSDDRNSVDLLARWPNDTEAIFEVKTVTMRNLSGRLRMAVGQVEEYAYRRNCAVGSAPEKVIVINSTIPANTWQVDFLLNTMNIGLLCTPAEEVFNGHAPANSVTARYWS